MTYKLAKKLKDAGFPSIRLEFENSCPENHIKSEMNCGMCVCLPPKFPTLSELIEACGFPFSLISKNGSEWLALGLGGKGGNYKTPEEAVANLWLKLNEK